MDNRDLGDFLEKWSSVAMIPVQWLILILGWSVIIGAVVMAFASLR